MFAPLSTVDPLSGKKIRHPPAKPPAPRLRRILIIFRPPLVLWTAWSCTSDPGPSSATENICFTKKSACHSAHALTLLTAISRAPRRFPSPRFHPQASGMCQASVFSSASAQSLPAGKMGKRQDMPWPEGAIRTASKRASKRRQVIQDPPNVPFLPPHPGSPPHKPLRFPDCLPTLALQSDPGYFSSPMTPAAVVLTGAPVRPVPKSATLFPRLFACKP